MYFLTLPGRDAVEKEGSAGNEILNDVVLIHIGRIVAGNEVGLVHQIGGLDGRLTEAQMADGNTAGLLGVIGEVALCIHVGVVADDLDGVLVGADGTVRAETPELAADGAFGGGVGILADLEGQMGHVILDTDGESLLAVGSVHVVVDSDDVCRSGVLGTDAVTAGGHLDASELAVSKGSNNVEIERLADGAGLLGSVDHADVLGGIRDSSDQTLCAERTIEVNLNNAPLLAGCVHVVDSLFDGIADGAHCDDDLVSIGCTVVIERLVVGADLGVDLVHVFLDNAGNCVIELVAGFSGLEEDVGVLSGAVEYRMLRVQRAAAECVNCIPVEHIAEVLIIPCLDLLDLVRGAEAVEEMEERHTALDSCQMSHSSEVHTFLRIVGAEHSVTCLTAGVNVGMIAKNGKSVECQRTCRNMDNAGEQLTGHLVHVRNHKEQALRSGVGGGESTGGKGAVNSAGGAAFGLHFRYLHFSAKEVLSACCGILVGFISHYGRRRDGVDRSNVGKRVGYVSHGVVAVHGFHFSCHVFFFLLKEFFRKEFEMRYVQMRLHS